MNPAPREAPVLETERLRLRPFRASDLATKCAIMGDERVTLYLGGMPLAREEVWRRMLCLSALWGMLGYGYWAVERRADDEMIGFVGFADFKREMTPPIEDLPEMGWIFAPEAQGQGFCTEAVRAALDWSEATLRGEPIVAIIDGDNAASIRVAERCGFSSREEATYRGKPILLFTRPAALEQPAAKAD